jgi:hypothetical protein
MCVRRDIEAFLAQDWSICGDDFIAEGFIGLDGRFNANPDTWRITFPTLDSYRDVWLMQSRDFNHRRFRENPREALFGAISISAIEFNGDTALVHKKFAGHLTELNGDQMPIRWQSLYFARNLGGRWRLNGFVGYLPGAMCKV